MNYGWFCFCIFVQNPRCIWFFLAHFWSIFGWEVPIFEQLGTLTSFTRTPEKSPHDHIMTFFYWIPSARTVFHVLWRVHAKSTHCKKKKKRANSVQHPELERFMRSSLTEDMDELGKVGAEMSYRILEMENYEKWWLHHCTCKVEKTVNLLESQSHRKNLLHCYRREEQVQSVLKLI